MSHFCAVLSVYPHFSEEPEVIYFDKRDKLSDYLLSYIFARSLNNLNVMNTHGITLDMCDCAQHNCICRYICARCDHDSDHDDDECDSDHGDDQSVCEQDLQRMMDCL